MSVSQAASSEEITCRSQIRIGQAGSASDKAPVGAPPLAIRPAIRPADRQRSKES